MKSDYQRSRQLAAGLGNFQPVQNGGFAGALAQGLAGFGAGYYGGKAGQQQDEVRKQLADKLAAGDTAGAMNIMSTSGIPEYEGIGLKSQMETAQKAEERKQMAQVLGIQMQASNVGSTPGAGAGTAPPAAGGIDNMSINELTKLAILDPRFKPALDVKLATEKQEKEQTKAQAEVTPPGFKIAGGVVPSADDSKKMKSLNEAQMNLSRLMDELGAIYDKMGGAMPVGVDADLARQKYEQAKIQLKELEQLGAIQAPDVPIIEGMMPNPSSPIEYGKEQIGIKSTKPRIDAFKNELKNRVSTRAKAFGYEPLMLPVTPDQVAPNQTTPQQPSADPNISGALQAIQSGAPRDAVKSRLLQNGYTQEQLKAAGL